MSQYIVTKCAMCGDSEYEVWFDRTPPVFIHCDQAGCGAPRDVVVKAKERFAFISRHAPTQGQISLAEARGIELIPVGDMDAFTVLPENVYACGKGFRGVVVVHPAAALRLAKTFVIGVFENANRAPEGERPQFEAADLHVYDMR